MTKLTHQINFCLSMFRTSTLLLWSRHKTLGLSFFREKGRNAHKTTSAESVRIRRSLHLKRGLATWEHRSYVNEFPFDAVFIFQIFIF